jgi:hypothetical protein
MESHKGHRRWGEVFYQVSISMPTSDCICTHQWPDLFGPVLRFFPLNPEVKDIFRISLTTSGFEKELLHL